MGVIPSFPELAGLLSEQLSVPKEIITPQSSFINDLGADSLDLVELQMMLEEKYKIYIPEKEGNRFKTVQDILDYINLL